MVFVNLQRLLAVLLFAVGFLALAASRAFPFLDDVPELVKTAVAVLGAACGLAGVYLWLRRSPDPEA
jgi:hypothetical protein